MSTQFDSPVPPAAIRDERARAQAEAMPSAPAALASFPKRLGVLIYGVSVYLLFLATFTYLVAFLRDLPVPHTLNRGRTGTLLTAVVTNLGLLTLFALQHSVMARPGFKKRLIKLIPAAAERSTYCLATCLVLSLLFLFWTAIPGVIWEVQLGWAQALLDGLGWIGIGLILFSSFLLNHFELFGLLQPYRFFHGAPDSRPTFKAPLLYKYVRHPIYLGMLLVIWSTPLMTVGHLLFALICSGYLWLGSSLEERDLASALGQEYKDYQEQVSQLVPIPGRSFRG